MLHIRPWEIEQLAVVEFLALCDYLDERAAKIAAATA